MRIDLFFPSWWMLKTMTANQNKELDHLKWSTTWLQRALEYHPLVWMLIYSYQYSYLYMYCSCCEQGITYSYSSVIIDSTIACISLDWLKHEFRMFPLIWQCLSLFFHNFTVSVYCNCHTWPQRKAKTTIPQGVLWEAVGNHRHSHSRRKNGCIHTKYL